MGIQLGAVRFGGLGREVEKALGSTRSLPMSSAVITTMMMNHFPLEENCLLILNEIDGIVLS